MCDMRSGLRTSEIMLGDFMLRMVCGHHSLASHTFLKILTTWSI